jgi:hypothetical protein
MKKKMILSRTIIKIREVWQLDYLLPYAGQFLLKFEIMSKRSEGKDDRADILDIVQTFCTSSDFEAEFEAFAREHAEVFQQAIKFTAHSNEHPLEFHDVYREYISKFECMIENYILKVSTCNKAMPQGYF